METFADISKWDSMVAAVPSTFPAGTNYWQVLGRQRSSHSLQRAWVGSPETLLGAFGRAIKIWAANRTEWKRRQWDSVRQGVDPH